MKGIWNLTLSVIVFGLCHCAQPVIPSLPPGGDNGNNNGNGKLNSGPCSIATPDSDGDGLSDECEKLLGTNPNDKDTNKNGIPDPKDCPPADPTCANVPEDFKSNALKDLLNGLLLGAGGMTGVPSPGTTTTITEHELRVSSGDAALPAEKSLCSGSSSYVYLKISGTINTCKVDPSRCAYGDQSTSLELCADTSKHVSKEQYEALSANGNTLTLDKLQWTQGSADGYNFNPGILNRDGSAGSFKLGITLTKVGNVAGCVAKISTDWESSLNIVGKLPETTTTQPVNIDVKVPKINKKWERYNAFSCTTSTLKGITGPWKVDTFL